MQFLFFDIECACCHKHGNGVMCEFGYVLTDEKFGVLEKEVLLVAPEDKFDWYVVQNMLAFDKEEYIAAPNFKKRYDKIKSLLEGDGVVVFGHTTEVDAHYLNYAASRYGLPFINFEFYDLKKIHMHKRHLRNGASLENILVDLQLEFEGHVHRSDDDAYATMAAVKELCRIYETDGQSLAAEYAKYRGSTKDGQITNASYVFTRKENDRRLISILKHYADKNTVEQSNFFYLTRLANSKSRGKIIDSPLNGKKICIDRDYQKTHFKEMISLIWLIKRHGGKCLFYPAYCDVFVNALPDGAERKHGNYLRRAQSGNAEIITLGQLLDIFNVTEDRLYNMPLPPAKAFAKREKE